MHKIEASGPLSSIRPLRFLHAPVKSTFLLYSSNPIPISLRRRYHWQDTGGSLGPWPCIYPINMTIPELSDEESCKHAFHHVQPSLFLTIQPDNSAPLLTFPTACHHNLWYWSQEQNSAQSRLLGRNYLGVAIGAMAKPLLEAIVGSHEDDLRGRLPRSPRPRDCFSLPTVNGPWPYRAGSRLTAPPSAS